MNGIDLLVEQLKCEEDLVVVYDFDGTLRDTNSIKNRALLDLFKEYHPPLAVKKYIEISTSESRAARITNVCGLLNLNPSSEELEFMLSRFKSGLLSKLKISEWTPFACEFIATIANKNSNQYILSKAPEDEIITQLNEKNLMQHFRGVYAGIEDKYSVLKKFKLTHNNLFYFGDTEYDCEIAARVGVNYIEVSKNQPNPFRKIYERL